MRKLNKKNLFEFLDTRRQGHLYIYVNYKNMTFEQVYRNNLTYLKEDKEKRIYFFELFSDTKKIEIKGKIKEIFEKKDDYNYNEFDYDGYDNY